MAYSYPIWNNIVACIYKSDKSFGAKDTSENNISVGSSSKNSHHFVNQIVTRRFKNEYKGFKNVCVFKISLDDIVLKEMIFEENNGRAGKLLKVNSKLNKIKSL